MRRGTNAKFIKYMTWLAGGNFSCNKQARMDAIHEKSLVKQIFNIRKSINARSVQYSIHSTGQKGLMNNVLFYPQERMPGFGLTWVGGEGGSAFAPVPCSRQIDHYA